MVKEQIEVKWGNTVIDNLTNDEIDAIIEDILDDSFPLILSFRRGFSWEPLSMFLPTHNIGSSPYIVTKVTYCR